MLALQTLREPGTIRTIERREYRVFAVGRAPTVDEARGGDAHPVGWLVTIHAGAPVGSQRIKERMAVGVHGSRRVENAERSISALKSVELGQYRFAARLNPGDLERVLILRALRAQGEGDSEDKEGLAHKNALDGD